MNKLQILQAVKEHNGESFTSLMNHLLSHPDHDPVADAAGIRNLIAAGHLSGEGRAPNSIRMTASGKDYLIDLEENEASHLANEKHRNEIVKSLQEDNKHLRDLVETLKMDLHLGIANAKAAEEDAKFSKRIAIASFILSVVSLIANIVQSCK